MSPVSVAPHWCSKWTPGSGADMISVATFNAHVWLRRTSVLVVIVSIGQFLANLAHGAEEAEAAQGPAFTIEVFVSSRADSCYDPGDIAAIKQLTLIEQNRINHQGGISGRPIEVKIRDDARDQSKTVGNMREALEQPQVLALVGLSNSTRGKAVFDALGPDILRIGVPFISDISVNSIFAAYPNVFTTRASQDTESIPVIANFTHRLNFARPAFVGLRDSVGSVALGDGLKSRLGDLSFLADIRLAGSEDKPDQNGVTAAIAEIKEKRPDIVYLYIGGSSIPDVMKQLVAAGVTPALFIGGRPETLPHDIANAYPNAIYSLVWDRPPELFNARLRKLISASPVQSWMFGGQKVSTAPGWSNGDCKPRAESTVPDPFVNDNMRAIGIGTQFADMVALVADAARTDDRSTDIERLRKQILNRLRTVYVAGRGAFKGPFDNWSFVATSRAAARDPFVIILPQKLGRTQLAPVQFVRSKDGSLRQIETLYIDIDLIRVYRVDENDKTFFADFYLLMRDNPGASIDKIEFANGYLDVQSGGGRQVFVQVIHPGGKSASYPDTMKIYKVSGRFMFEPLLAKYPFDSQRFSVDLQPKSGETPFIIQPPPLELRDKTVIATGWDPQTQYVGYDRDYLPVLDAYTHEPSVAPFYKVSFAWLMQRQTTDYLLRVAVPLGFILFVAYLSIFIPRKHFEAIVTIQVTALLSAVALYLSLPKLESDNATLSDRAFVFAYMIVSIMMGISILRITPLLRNRKGVDFILKLLHVAAIPAFVAVASYYVYGLSTAAN
jgi:ABC-type branched-subunit amino acid transport system substrate-binding protein